jgi:hypothetical protein
LFGKPDQFLRGKARHEDNPAHVPHRELFQNQRKPLLDRNGYFLKKQLTAYKIECDFLPLHKQFFDLAP